MAAQSVPGTMVALKRAVAVSALVIGSLLIGVIAGGVPGFMSGGAERYSVEELLDALPFERQVVVEANVSAVLEDYTSESGTTFQRFRVTDGEEEVLVFCSTAEGRIRIEPGDGVTVSGTFQEFYGTYEIYTDCSSIEAW